MTGDGASVLRDAGHVVLSNPWFGVGGLERVYLAVTAATPGATIVAAKNFHDTATFHFFFGDHRPFPRIHDAGLMVDASSDLVYTCMNEAIHGFFDAWRGDPVAAHVTNHWGLFHVPRIPDDRCFVYFQPGVFEMERVAADPVLLELYKRKLARFPVLANSIYMQGIVEERFGCASTVVYPCTDTAFFASEINPTRESIEVKPHDIMIFSRLNPGKQFSRALDIFSAIHAERPGTRFVVAGAIRREEMHFLEELQVAANIKGIGDAITFVPNPSLVDLKGLYGKAKLLLFLPRNEPLGLVAVEAIRAGVPVVGFAEGGVLETVQDGVTGALCKDEPGMVEAAARLLDAPGEISRLAGNAPLVEGKFSETAFVDALARAITR